MTTKETKKLNIIEISKTFFKNKWSKQLVTTYDQAGKKLNHQK